VAAVAGRTATPSAADTGDSVRDGPDRPRLTGGTGRRPSHPCVLADGGDARLERRFGGAPLALVHRVAG